MEFDGSFEGLIFLRDDLLEWYATQEVFYRGWVIFALLVLKETLVKVGNLCFCCFLVLYEVGFIIDCCVVFRKVGWFKKGVLFSYQKILKVHRFCEFCFTLLGQWMIELVSNWQNKFITIVSIREYTKNIVYPMWAEVAGPYKVWYKLDLFPWEIFKPRTFLSLVLDSIFKVSNW